MYCFNDETRVGFSYILELWREALESKSFKLSRTKAEYMECKFSIMKKKLITVVGEEVTHRNQFCYLGLIIHNNEEIEEDVIKLKQVG